MTTYLELANLEIYFIIISLHCIFSCNRMTNLNKTVTYKTQKTALQHPMCCRIDNTNKPVVDVARDAQCCVLHMCRSHTRTSSKQLVDTWYYRFTDLPTAEASCL